MKHEIVIALCAASFLAIACGLGETEEPAPTAPHDAVPTTAPGEDPPEVALRRWVQDRLNQGFVPDCEQVRRPGDVGKQCARLRSVRSGMLAYELGPAFSEATRLFILQAADGAWTITHQETLDPDLPGIPWPLQVGVTVVVAGAGDCLQVRDQPGLQGVPVDCLEDGTTVTISAGPAERDGLQWWRLSGYGWSAGNWLRYPEEPAATPEQE